MLKLRYFALSSLIFLFMGCGSSSGTPSPTPTPTPIVKSSGISFGFKDTGDTEPEYLNTQKNLMKGEISVQGTGIEQLGWNFFYNVGKTLFITTYTDDATKSYFMDENGDIKQKGTFFFDEQLVMFGNVDNHTMLVTDASHDGTHSIRKLYTVDASTGHITSKVNYTIDDNDTGTPGEGTIAWATALKVRANELYIPFHKLDDQGYYTTPDPDKAYVAIYDYPLIEGAVPKKIISDDRTSNIGVNGMTSSIIEAENGDLYTFSNGSQAAGFVPASTKPSGILRIKNGETEFDQNYFFDINATTGGTLFWFDYIGDNKAIGRIITNNDGEATPWSAYTKNYINQKLVIIDLVNKTVTDVANVPLHQKRYTSPINVMDGKVYVSIETADDAYVYQVDIATATGTKGAKIMGKTIKGFFDLTPSK